MSLGAEISKCGRYRYFLWRKWSDGPAMSFVMLNPSTADARVDDPTIRRCIGFAKREGCGMIGVVNLFSYRATDPGELTDPTIDPVGPDTAWWWDRVFDGAVHQGPVVVGWGATPIARLRGLVFAEHAAVRGVQLQCLGVTRDGSPKHPLYLKADTPLIGWPAS